MENSQIENNKDQLLHTPTRKSLLSNLSKSQKISLATLSFFVAIIPLGTSAALLTTRLNSRAYLPATPPTPPITITPTASPSATPIICNNPVKTFSVQRPCRSTETKVQDSKDKVKNKITYQYANITCQNSYKELYKSQTCLSEEQLKSIAEQICQKHTTCPTPTIANKPPVIQTNTLPTATIGRNYTATIIITDQDSKDTLTATTSPLPSNLKFICRGKDERKNLVCQITGTPRQVGNFNIQVTAKDNKGATTTKTLKLSVQSRPSAIRI